MASRSLAKFRFPSYMGTHIDAPIWRGAMKTTIEISDALLREARKVAAQQGITLRALVERGLHRVLAETKQRPPFRMRDGSFGGEGLHPDVRDLSWDEIIELSYEGRGGSSLEQLREKRNKGRGG
jgi:hypothetical protein